MAPEALQANMPPIEAEVSVGSGEKNHPGGQAARISASVAPGPARSRGAPVAGSGGAGRMRFMREKSIAMPPRGTAPPVIPVRAPCGVTGRDSARARASTLATSPSVEGKAMKSAVPERRDSSRKKPASPEVAGRMQEGRAFMGASLGQAGGFVQRKARASAGGSGVAMGGTA